MVGVVKDYKKVLKENGVDEDRTYIRIRPAERDGKVRVKADLKAKDGGGGDSPPSAPGRCLLSAQILGKKHRTT